MLKFWMTKTSGVTCKQRQQLVHKLFLQKDFPIMSPTCSRAEVCIRVCYTTTSLTRLLAHIIIPCSRLSDNSRGEIGEGGGAPSHAATTTSHKQWFRASKNEEAKFPIFVQRPCFVQPILAAKISSGGPMKGSNGGMLMTSLPAPRLLLNSFTPLWLGNRTGPILVNVCEEKILKSKF